MMDFSSGSNIMMDFSSGSNIMMATKSRRSKVKSCFIFFAAFCFLSVSSLLCSFIYYNTINQQNNNIMRRRKLSSSLISTSSRPATNELPDEFQLAYKESMGFINDIPEKSWLIIKKYVQKYYSQPAPIKPIAINKDPHLWYQNSWEPNFSCLNEVRIGGMGDGPKWVCNPYRIAESVKERRQQQQQAQQQQERFMENEDDVNGDGVDGDDDSVVEQPCLIYSFGSSGNFMFENGIQQFPGLEDCEIHIFDPDDYKSVTPPNMHFHNWGIVAEGLQKKHGPKFKSMQDTVDILGHKNRIVDIFKIDCEGCEWATFKNWFNCDLDIRQILVETHYVYVDMNDFFTTLRDEGYVIFHKEPNTIANGMCQEYAFLKLDKHFFE